MTYGVGGAVAATVLGAVLVLDGTASATEGFTCPAGTSAVEVPYAFTADRQPLLAGTVCVVEGTTRFSSLDVETGWTAQVKSDGTGSNARTDVRFSQASTGDRVALIYEPGLFRIK